MPSCRNSQADITLLECEPAPQTDLSDTPYDRWVTPDGKVAAEFRRVGGQHLIRFPAQADFAIDLSTSTVQCTPASAKMREAARTLFRNAIVPLIGNHHGQMHLHGSAVHIGGQAIAFVGTSRSGKTTLAGAFAKAGHPFLTEDVLALSATDGTVMVKPAKPVLRLLPDSASFLLGRNVDAGDALKTEMEAGDALPFWDKPAKLGAIFLMGTGDCTAPKITKLPQAKALAQLMQHAFILDVEDRARMRIHFDRLAQLAGAVSCYQLDYPRSYTQLPGVIDGVLEAVSTLRGDDETD